MCFQIGSVVGHEVTLVTWMGANVMICTHMMPEIRMNRLTKKKAESLKTTCYTTLKLYLGHVYLKKS